MADLIRTVAGVSVCVSNKNKMDRHGQMMKESVCVFPVPSADRTNRIYRRQKKTERKEEKSVKCTSVAKSSFPAFPLAFHLFN